MAADVAFMQGMIHHHAQAVEMTTLLATRTASDDMRKLGQRIQISQTDEIKMMQHWLQARGQILPSFIAGGTFNSTVAIQTTDSSYNVVGELNSSFLDKRLLLDVRAGVHLQRDSYLPGDGSTLDDLDKITDELLAMTAPVPPTQVFRFTAPCQEGACSHFDGHD